jgi:methyltransferase (TIGR00027 family)
MTRTDDDTWDLASSVGATATMVAAARAVATKSPDPLINDPFAEPLVTAVGVDFFTQLAHGELNLADIDDDPALGVRRMTDGMAVRTRYFDDFFLDAVNAGIRQVVILASGLDSRAYRLPWPGGTTVYELDQPQVIEFKTTTLARLGAEPTADRRPVAVDLRTDWPTALKNAGLEPARPTAWIAEGLLGYLPPEAQDRLLDDITALSAEGSRFATESVATLGQSDQDHVKQYMQNLADRWKDHGFDLDMSALIYFGDRNEAATYLSTHGWESVGVSTKELFAEHGLEPLEDANPFGEVVYVSATLV